MKTFGAILSVILAAGFLLALSGCDDLYERASYRYGHGYYQRYDRDDDDDAYRYRGEPRRDRWGSERERREHGEDDD